MPTLPQVLVQQQLTLIPDELVNPLRALIIGPEYALHRYNVDGEEAPAVPYDSLSGNSIDWVATLGRRPGSTVDFDYTEIHVDNAALQYWSRSALPNETGQGYTSPDAYLAYIPNGHRSRLTIEGFNLVGVPGYSLNPSLYGRNVKIGDRVLVTGTVDDNTYSGEAVVTGFIPEVTASVVGTAYGATGNKQSQAAVSPTSDIVEGDTELVVSGTYDGTKVGVLNESYTVTVRRGSTNLDPKTMILDIVSASGKDTIIGYIPTGNDFSDPILIGNNGLEALFEDSSSGGAPDYDIEAGSQWTVSVGQKFDAPSATSGGSYTGITDTTYIVNVVRGGDISAPDNEDKPVISVTTSTGVDASASQVLSANSFSVGHFGVTVTLDETILCAGDKYLIPVSAEGTGAVQTITLDRNLPAGLVSTGTQKYDLSVTLAISDDIVLDKYVQSAGKTNWSQTAEGIQVEASAVATHREWRGGSTALPVLSGDIYVHWRELVTTRANQVNAITTLSDLTNTYDTPNNPDNPLVYAATKALQNSNGASIRVLALNGTNLQAWADALGVAETRSDVYTLVPLTKDPEVLNLVHAHVSTQSSPEEALWRTAIFAADEVNPVGIITENPDGTAVTATIGSDRYLDVEDDAGNDVDFLEAGVKAGDVVRTNYTLDNSGQDSYDTYVIDQVVSATRVRLLTAPSDPVTVGTKIEIWKTLTPNEIVEEISHQAGRYADRRITLVYPGKIYSGGVEVEGYHLAAAIAGLRGGVPPHQGLTNVTINGFDHVDSVVNRFSRSQLDAMSDGGVWIVTHDINTGEIHTRHALTTDTLDLNRREEMRTRNLDSISYFFHSRIQPYIGRANVTPTMTAVLSTQITGGIAYLRTASETPELGGQIIDGELVTLRPHAFLIDRYVAVINFTLPAPFNYMDPLTLVI